MMCMSVRLSPITSSRLLPGRGNHPRIELGASPRAGIALVKGSRARALIHGRNYVIPEDLFALADDVILHRIRLTYEALADGLTGPDVLKEIIGPYGLAPTNSNGMAKRN